MKDLIALHAAYPDRVGDGLINVRKMNLIGGIFQVNFSRKSENPPVLQLQEKARKCPTLKNIGSFCSCIVVVNRFSLLTASREL